MTKKEDLAGRARGAVGTFDGPVDERVPDLEAELPGQRGLLEGALLVALDAAPLLAPVDVVDARERGPPQAMTRGELSAINPMKFCKNV